MGAAPRRRKMDFFIHTGGTQSIDDIRLLVLVQIPQSRDKDSVETFAIKVDDLLIAGDPDILHGFMQALTIAMADGPYHDTIVRTISGCGDERLLAIDIQAITVRFAGDADLGKEYGIYHWTGQIADGAFTGEYRSDSGKTGKFTMARQ